MSENVNGRWLSKTAVATLVAAAATTAFSQPAFAVPNADSAKLTRQNVCVTPDGALHFGNNPPPDCDAVTDTEGNRLSVGRSFGNSTETPDEDYVLLGPDGQVVRDRDGLVIRFIQNWHVTDDDKVEHTNWYIARANSQESKIRFRYAPDTPLYSHSRVEIRDDPQLALGLRQLDLNRLKNSREDDPELRRWLDLEDTEEPSAVDETAEPPSQPAVAEPAVQSESERPAATGDDQAVIVWYEAQPGPQEPVTEDQVVIDWYDTTAQVDEQQPAETPPTDTHPATEAPADAVDAESGEQPTATQDLGEAGVPLR